ncbi:hypothetical protein H5410_030154 [Solanum commersonii]|uniref:Uncharacterized protein n=1 Tax=Solanum commersonii TaxID=4109 RepID=A0A9J5YGM6_SOLCO|nr:hypothetical protein H5410_030154 [Solanum commersonii]
MYVVCHCWGFYCNTSSSRKLKGDLVFYKEIRIFFECTQDLHLSELNWMGDYYTWTNRQHGADRVSRRIDIVLGNYEWLLNWEHIYVHSKRKVPFKFFNVWTEHNQFTELVQGVWQQYHLTDNLRDMWRKQQELQYALKQCSGKQALHRLKRDASLLCFTD